MKSISEDTFHAISRLLDSILEYSVSVEALRQRLCLEVGIDLQLAFNFIIRSGKSLLDPRDLDKLYRSRNIAMSYRDIAEYFKIFDVDRDGKLSYVEFARSFMPLMGVKYHN